MTSTIADRLAALDTPALSDALDRLGIDGQVVGILPLDTSFRLVGTAFTVRMLPRGLSGKSVGDYIDEVSPGVAAGGRLVDIRERLRYHNLQSRSTTT